MENQIIEEVLNYLDSDIKIKENILYEEILNKNYPLMIFIDGGNNEIFSSPTFSLNIIKISAIIFENNIKKKILNYECKIICKENEIKIFSKNDFNWKNKKLDFNERTAEIYRRINEINLANILLEQYQNSAIILDGSLNSQYNDINEKNMLNDLIKNSKNSNSEILGLIKTNREKNPNGNTLFKEINVNSPLNKTWITEIKEKNNVYYTYSKLHRNSEYIFKIEFTKKEKIKDIVSGLISNSSDPIFQGYPYGLILADKFAKVSKEELNFKKMKVNNLLDNNKNLKIELNTLNIHDKIDNINK
jgi:hypothetical protein